MDALKDDDGDGGSCLSRVTTRTLTPASAPISWCGSAPRGNQQLTRYGPPRA